MLVFDSFSTIDMERFVVRSNSILNAALARSTKLNLNAAWFKLGTSAAGLETNRVSVLCVREAGLCTFVFPSASILYFSS